MFNDDLELNEGMKTFRNGSFTKRDYDCSNIVACQTEDGEYPKIPGNWILDMDFDLSGLTKLYICANTRVFGYL